MKIKLNLTLIILLSLFTLTACGEKEPTVPTDVKEVKEKPTHVLTEQLKVLDQAKALEKQMQDDADKKREEINKQTAY